MTDGTLEMMKCDDGFTRPVLEATGNDNNSFVVTVNGVPVAELNLFASKGETNLILDVIPIGEGLKLNRQGVHLFTNPNTPQGKEAIHKGEGRFDHTQTDGRYSVLSIDLRMQDVGD
jgi:hypothetical protein